MEPEFFAAVQRGNGSAVSAMLRRDPQLARAATEHAKTGLHWAAETDDVEVARLLVDAGADIDAETSWGATPLDWAAVMGSARVAELLLARGATGLTLTSAAALGKIDVVQSVIESGVDLRAHVRRGAPPAASGDEWPADTAHVQGDVLSDAMYAAARNGYHHIVALLLDTGAKVDAKGFFGATALHWAAINGHRQTVDLLLSRGASVTVRDARFNATPERWAVEGGYPDIARVLKAFE